MATTPDPLRIFRPGGPIPLPVLDYLLNTTLPAIPGFHGATPDSLALLRRALMHLIAVHEPQDVAQAMLAARMVMFHLHAMECLRTADLPGTPPDIGLRLQKQAASLLRGHAAMLRDLEGRHGRSRRDAARQSAPPLRRVADVPATQPERPASPECGQDAMPGGEAPAQAQHWLRLVQDSLRQKAATFGPGNAAPDPSELVSPGPEVTRH